MFTYENGILLSLACSLFDLIQYVLRITSLKSSNLRKIGFYYSPVRSAWMPAKTSWYFHVLYVAYSLAIRPFLSWLYVGVFLVFTAGDFWIYLNRPEKLKELQILFKKKSLSKEQAFHNMVACYKARGMTHLQAVVAVEEGSLLEGEQSSAYVKSTDEDGWRREIALDKEKRILQVTTIAPDLANNSRVVYKYRTNGTVLEWKTVHMEDGGIGRKPIVRITDNVIQYENLTTDTKKVSALKKSRAEEIEDLTREVEWKRVRTSSDLYYVLANGCDISAIELRRFFQNEIQRIERGFFNFSLEVKEKGGEVVKEGSWYRVEMASDRKDDVAGQSRPFDDASWKKRELTADEFVSKDEIISELKIRLKHLPEVAA